MRPLLALLVLAACTTGAANHLNNPLLWPVMAVSSGVDNGIYDARRSKVAAHVAAHHPGIIAESPAGSGPLLSEAMDLARVPAARRGALLQALRQEIALYRRNQEALVVALMVHGR